MSGKQMVSLSFVNMPGLVGLMAESKKGLFEVYLDKDDNTHFYHRGSGCIQTWSRTCYEF